MLSANKRYSTLIIFSFSVMLALAISSAMYFMKIQKNEDYQNRLHFRELNEVSRSVIQSLGQLTELSKVCSDKAQTDKQVCDELLAKRVVLANRSDNLRSLTLKQHSLGPDDTHLIEFDTNGKTVVAVKFTDPVYANYVVSRNSLEVDTSNFVPAYIERFPLVLIADESGKVIASKQTNRRGVETADLQFDDINHLFSRGQRLGVEGAHQEESNDLKPASSEIIDITLGGVNYRIFVQLANMQDFDTNQTKLYILGLVPANDLRLAKLSVSPNTAVWFVLILIILISLLPVLKLRFVSVKYAFSRGDVTHIGLGLLVAIGMSSIAITHQLFFGFLMQDKSAQIEQLHGQITADFATEIRQLQSWFKHGQRQHSASAQSCEQVAGLEQGNFSSCVNPNLVWPSREGSKTFDYIIEGTFELNEKGHFAEGSRTVWKAESIKVKRAIDLSHREYFQKAKQCDVWGNTDNQQKCSQGLIFERINNVRDGRKNTQFGIPMFDNLATGERKVFSFGTRLKTFFHRVMPKDVGFLVFEPGGKVLFHSDEQRSLIENVYVETDNNKQLHVFVANQKFESGEPAQPVTFQAIYRGRSHLFSIGDLFSDPEYANAPLTLVVFFDQTNAELNNMLLLFMAIIIFLVVIFPIFIYLRYATSQPFWASFLYFNPRHARRYSGWLLLLVGGSLFCLFSMGVIFDLTLRLSVWLLTGLLIFNRIIRSLDVHGSALRGYRPGLHILWWLAVLLALVGLAYGPIPAGNRSTNWVFLMLGAAALVEGILLNVNQAETQENASRFGQTERYSKAYLGFWVAALFFVAAVPASLIVNSANGYLLQHQARSQSQHLQLAEQHYQAKLADYKMIVGESGEANFSAPQWFSPTSLASMFPGIKQQWVAISSSLNEQRTDKVIQAIFANIEFADSILAELSHLAKQQNQILASGASQSEQSSLHVGPAAINQITPTKTDKRILHYLPDIYMQQATGHFWYFSLFSMLIQLFIIHRVVELIVVRRLFGDHLSDDFRISHPREHLAIDQKWQNVIGKLNAAQPARLLMLHSSRQQVMQRLATLKPNMVDDQVQNIANLLDKNDGQFCLLSRLTSSAKQPPEILIIDGYEQLAFLPELRRQALALSEALVKCSAIHLMIVADTAPLFRLIKQDEYPKQDLAQVASASEELAWAKLFSEFTKCYDWTPMKKYMPIEAHNLNDLLNNEATGWPELRAIKDSFIQYHKLIKLQDPQARVTEQNLYAHWQAAQIIAYFAMNAGALYRMKWELCTKDERFLLYQLAAGGNLNPLNAEALEHLTRRGYIYRDAGWHLINDSFKRFVLHAERESAIVEWQADANMGIWSMLRIPIFTLVLVLLVVTVFSSGQAIDSALGILTAVLGLIPLLLRNVSLLKGGNTSVGE